MKAKRHNKIGQIMHSKGFSTRRRIIDQTMLLMRNTPSHKVLSAEIARACGLTPPGLYLYFEGVPDIVLARLEEISEVKHPYMELLEEPWGETELWQKAKDFVRSYGDYWREYDVALRYRNLMSDQGDDRFKQMRVTMTKPISQRLVARVIESQQRGFIPSELSPVETAAAALSLIDHSAATASSPYGSWNDKPFDRDRFLDAAAYMLISLVRGKFETDQRPDAAAVTPASPAPKVQKAQKATKTTKAAKAKGKAPAKTQAAASKHGRKAKTR